MKEPDIIDVAADIGESQITALEEKFRARFYEA